MSSKREQFVKNVCSDWLSTIICGVAGFAIFSLNVRHLDRELFGIFCLSFSCLSIFGHLSFGLSPTLLRFFSRSIVDGDKDKFREYSSTGQFLLGCLGLIGATLFLLSYKHFVVLYNVKKDYHFDLLVLFFALAFHFLHTFFLIPFRSMIQANNRFDLTNLNRVLSSLLRMLVLWFGYSFFTPSLMKFAAASFIGSFFEVLFVVFVAYAMHGRIIFFNCRYVSLKTVPSLFSFSVFAMMSNIFFSLSIQLPVLIIGKTLGNEMVSFISPSVTLGTYLSTFLNGLSNPLAPLASRDIKESGGENIGKWSIALGTVTSSVGCCFIVLLFFIGDGMIYYWLGDPFVWTKNICVILVSGIVIAAVQEVNYRLAVGANSVAPFGISAFFMALLTAGGTLLGTIYFSWSLLEVSILIASIRILRNIFYLPWVYSKRFHYNYRTYLWRVYVKPLLLVMLFIFLGLLCKKWFSTNFSLVDIFCTGLPVTMVFVALAWRWILHEDVKSQIRAFLRLK